VRRGLRLLPLLAVALGACKAGRGVVQIDVDSDGIVAGVDRLRVVVTLAGQASLPADFALPGAPVSIPPAQTANLALPPGRSGAITVRVDALDTAGGLLASGSASGEARAGEDSSFRVTVPGAHPADMAASTDGADALAPRPDLASPADAALAAPRISSIAPALGPSTGNLTVTLTGEGFQPGAQVTFGGVMATNVIWASSTKLTASLPPKPGAFGEVGVILANPDGTVASSTSLFSYYLKTIDFAAPASYPTGAQPDSIAAGDFNHDGKLDLAAENYMGASLGILLGRGDGTFEPPVNYAVGAMPTDVTVRDYDGDGNLDVAVPNQGTNDVTVLLGKGDGTFRAGVSCAAAAGPYAMNAGDVDGDGKLDLVVCARSARSVALLLGNGDGTFQAPRSFAAGVDPDHVAVGDLNGDGLADAVVADFGNQTFNVMLAKPGGSFSMHADVRTGTKPDFALLRDLNGDGKLDVVSSNYGDNQVDVFFGAGDGTFMEDSPYVTGVSPTCVALDDVNLDGIGDLIVADASSNGVTILPGLGGGAYGNRLDFPAGMTSASVWSGDFNGDGKIDLATSNLGSNDVTVLLNRSR